MNLQIPKQAFFNVEFSCPFRANSPVIDGDLKDWDAHSLVPELVSVAGKEPFAEMFMAWNDDGLYFAIQVKGKSNLEVQPRRPLRGDGLQIWVDTRDVRTAHRASRYCHHFCFLPKGGSKGAVGRQLRIRRARAQGRLCEPGKLSVASRILKTGYRMEIHVPASVLTGFDPEENSRLGFTYLLKDKKLGRQAWSSEEVLPVAYDPSLWGTADLIR